MTALDDIYTVAAMLCPVRDGEEETLRMLSAAAAQQLRSRLLPKTDEDEIYESFVCAAGMLAAADFYGCKASGGVKSFSAGPVSVTKDDSAAADNLRQQAAMIMGPWCQDAFRFLGVKA